MLDRRHDRLPAERNRGPLARVAISTRSSSNSRRTGAAELSVEIASRSPWTVRPVSNTFCRRSPDEACAFPFAPTMEQPFNSRLAAHLHRRAVLPPTRDLDEAVKLGSQERVKAACWPRRTKNGAFDGEMQQIRASVRLPRTTPSSCPVVVLHRMRHLPARCWKNDAVLANGNWRLSAARLRARAAFHQQTSACGPTRAGTFADLWRGNRPATRRCCCTRRLGQPTTARTVPTRIFAARALELFCRAWATTAARHPSTGPAALPVGSVQTRRFFSSTRIRHEWRQSDVGWENRANSNGTTCCGSFSSSRLRPSSSVPNCGAVLSSATSRKALSEWIAPLARSFPPRSTGDGRPCS